MQAGQHVSAWPVRALDRFLQPQNIKWVLATGVVLLLGSSLMLVGHHWHAYTPVWKLVIMLAYGSALYVASQWTYHRMALRTTGTVLMGMTVVTWPILLAALHWVGGSGSAAGATAGVLLLLPATAAMAWLSARRIFRHFFRGPQPTFTAAYVTLAAAAYLTPAWVPASLAPLAALGLWAVMTAGAVKISRRVFWLVEEGQHPRVLGFFPVALLGLELLLTFCAHLVSHVSVPWLGLGVVLVAVPVLSTTDALAKVFQQRTGDLVRPLPEAIVVPLVTGLVLCAGGVALACTALGSPGLPLPIAPTALTAAVVLGMAARRTGNPWPAWAALLTFLLGYNFSPAFFVETARGLVAASAASVRETSLPFAFYGFTYLPVLLALVGLARGLAGPGFAVLVVPARQLAVGLTVLLAVLAGTHGKALFPVGMTMAAMLALQAVAFRRRALASLAVATALFALCGVPLFARGVLGVVMGYNAIALMFGAAAAALLVMGLRWDRWLDGVAASTGTPRTARFGSRGSVLARVSAWVTAAVAVAWLPTAAQWTHPAWDTAALDALVVALAAAQSLRWLRVRPWSIVALLLLNLSATLWLGRWGVSPAGNLTAMTLMLMLQWEACRAWRARPRPRFARLHAAFAHTGYGVAAVVLAVVVLLYHAPTAAALVGGVDNDRLPIPLVVRALMVLFAVRATRHSGSVLLGVVSVVSAVSAVSSGWIALMGPAWAAYVPAVLCACALAWAPVARRLQGQRALALLHQESAERAAGLRALLLPTEAAARGITIVTLCVGMLWLPLPARVAAAVACLGLWAWSVATGSPKVSTVAVVAHWQAIATVLYFATADATTVFDIRLASLPELALPLGLVGALGLLLPWRRWLREASTLETLDVSAPTVEPAELHVGLLPLAVGAMLALSLFGGGLSATGTAMAVAIFVLLVWDRLSVALTTQRERPVWAAEVIAGFAVAYFASTGVISFGRGLSLFAVLGSAAVLWAAGRWAAGRPRAGILAEPLLTTALWLPCAVVPLAVGRHLLGRHGLVGLNSAALLLAGGAYFWHGLRTRSSGWLVGSAVIGNLALALMWQQLSWTDPQLYMIPLGLSVLGLTYGLRAEIPARAHDTLYYAGALCIMVSPTFHIVSGSWVHLLSLMLCSALMVLAAIALRLRALVYTGTAFLVVDMVAMVVRGSLHRPSVLWLVGLALGVAVITLGAAAERHREELLQKMRALSTELASWS